MSKERDCRVKACLDGECQHCKRRRRERGDANGRWVLEKCAEKGLLPEVEARAECMTSIAIAELWREDESVPNGAVSSFRSEMVEWF
jgi:hypothetical protein